MAAVRGNQGGFSPPAPNRLPSENGAGFTLIELVLVIAIFVFILGWGGILSMRFYYQAALDGERDAAVNILRRARSEAISNTNQSDYGVYFGGNDYLLFEGNSYVVRNASSDQMFPKSSAIGVSGFSEVVFSALRGNSSASGTLYLSNGNATRTVTVNHEGQIDW